MKKSAMHEVRQKKKLMGRLVKLVELVKKCWKAISSRVRRHALRHF